MTDRELQDLFDRHLRPDSGDESDRSPPAPGSASTPEGADPADVEAYRLVYAALAEEPEGDLPPDFADRVADRVDLQPVTEHPGSQADAWWAGAPSLAEVASAAALLLGMLVAALLVPSVGAALQTTLQDAAALTTRSLQPLADAVRLDVVSAAALALAATLLADRLFSRLRLASRLQHR